MTPLKQPVSQALAPRKHNIVVPLVLLLAVMVCAGAAGYGYYLQSLTEQVVVAVKPLVFGQQITAEDVGTIEVPLHRPQQLAGITMPEVVVGKWASGDVRPNDLIQPAMLLDQAPDAPVFPSGEELAQDMVVLPFSTETVGPLTNRDLINIGFNDPSGEPTRCMSAGGSGAGAPSVDVAGKPQPYACRLVPGVNVLHVDVEQAIAYLEVPPATSHAVWSLQAAGLQLWGERQGSTSEVLAPVDRLDPAQIQPEMVTIPGQIQPATAQRNGDTAPASESTP